MPTWNVRFLYKHLMGRASIAWYRPVPTSIRCVQFLEASDGAGIHRWQSGIVQFLEASDEASIHRCQPATSGSNISIRWGEHPLLPTCNVRFLYKHLMGRASIAGNLVTSGSARLACMLLDTPQGLSQEGQGRCLAEALKQPSCDGPYARATTATAQFG